MDGKITEKPENKLLHIFNQSKKRLVKILPLDATLFALQFLKHPQDIGALSPSSQRLAEAMTRYVKKESEKSSSKYYLEAGAGTGSFTKAIIEKLSPEDHLDIIEINPNFCKEKGRFSF